MSQKQVDEILFCLDALAGFTRVVGSWKGICPQCGEDTGLVPDGWHHETRLASEGGCVLQKKERKGS